ncbi:HtaA domain-containing protein [Zafaria sp. Z1313]|uniref:HtaA domain-containing protein n=1 Tax=Zafaria sp. Z1313 TaxID=3423202 RepID=UPI003D301C8B
MTPPYVGLGQSGHAGFYAAATASALVEGQTVWVATGNSTGTTAAGRTAPLSADGSFSLTLTVPAGAASGFTVYTSKAHGQGTTNTSQNVRVQLSATQAGTGTGTPSTGGNTGGSTGGNTGTNTGTGTTVTTGSTGTTTQDTKPVYETVCLSNAVSGATLTWGVKDSFRNYIRSGIAQGGWTINCASYNGSDFVFTGGTGSYSTANRTGWAQFGGSRPLHRTRRRAGPAHLQPAPAAERPRDRFADRQRDLL